MVLAVLTAIAEIESVNSPGIMGGPRCPRVHVCASAPVDFVLDDYVLLMSFSEFALDACF
jgi:hypothetical protein